MKYCTKCGTQLADDAKFCSSCGTAQSAAYSSQYRYNDQPISNTSKPAVNDGKSFGLALLGFFVPLVGLILYLIWKDDTPLRAKSAGKGALAGAILGVIFIIAFIVLFFVAVSMGAFSETGFPLEEYGITFAENTII